jgi:hypothetical protein
MFIIPSETQAFLQMRTGLISSSWRGRSAASQRPGGWNRCPKAHAPGHVYAIINYKRKFLIQPNPTPGRISLVACYALFFLSAESRCRFPK